MSFQTEIIKPYSEKFCLVRLSCKLTLALTSNGFNFYSATYDKYIFECYAKSTLFTQVNSPSSDGEFSYNYETKTLTLYSTTSITSAIVKVYIYVTNDKNRAIGRDPTLNSGIIEWRGVLKESPSFSQSIENVQNEVISINTSSIILINKNSEFDFLLERDSFLKGCQFDVWFCCNGVSNIQKIFSGFSSDCSTRGLELTIRTYDAFEKLNNPPYSIYNSNNLFTTEFYPNRDPNKDGFAIPSYFSQFTWFKPYSVFNAPSVDLLGFPNPETMPEAFCSSYSETISTSTNRVWECFAGDMLTNVFITTCSVISPTVFSFSFSLPFDYGEFSIGDRFSAESGASLICMEVTFVDEFRSYIYAKTFSSNPNTGTNNITSYPIKYVAVYHNGSYTIINPLDHYNVTDGTLTLVDNFEASTIIDAINPESDKVVYKTSVGENWGNQTIYDRRIVGRICESSGASFNYGDAGKYECAFSIPEKDDTSIQSSLYYISKILISCCSYIGIDENGAIFYKYFESPSNGLEINDSDILLDSLTIEEKSQDLKSSVKINPTFLESSEENNVAVKLSDSEYLGIRNNLNIDSVVYPFSQVVSENLYLDIAKQQLVKFKRYSFKTKTKGYGLLLGDSVKLNGIDLTVVAIDKSIDEISIVAVDTYKT